MALLQEITRTQNEQIRISEINNQQMIGLRGGEAYASYFPSWEVTAPQYPFPAAYSLEQLFIKNGTAYSCVDLWMKTISEPPIRVYDKTTDEEIKGHELTSFMENPCPGVSQTDFWMAVQLFLKIAGAITWEKDIANDGSLLSLWPMFPQYCSYFRGQGQLLRSIRYQPYTGLPYLDIPIERTINFMYPNPLYYGLKPLAPVAVLAPIIGVDNDMTDVIAKFLKNGAFISGILQSDQIIDAEDARFARERFRESHGGPQNAGDVVVVGKGMTFSRMNNTFREMVFPEVDARNEVRICQAFGVKPILVSAKVGMDRSTMNNYKEARASWYEENVTSEWKFLQERVTRDLLPMFDDDPNHEARFDISGVKALQEDRNATWTRAIEAYKNRIITRNDALKEMGLDLLDDTALAGEYYTTTMSQTSTAISDNLDTPNTSTPAADEKPKDNGADANAEADAKQEEKYFHTFADKRVKEGNAWKIPLFEFKYVPPDRQRVLLSKYGVLDESAEKVFQALMAVVNVNA